MVQISVLRARADTSGLVIRRELMMDNLPIRLLICLAVAASFRVAIAKFFNPCKNAGAYMGDAALNDEEYSVAQEVEKEVADGKSPEKIVSESRAKRGATSLRNRLWEDAIVPYEIDAQWSVPHHGLFRQAMEHWEKSTCLVFVPKEPHHRQFIRFQTGDCGCCSPVGRQPGYDGQGVNLGENCDKFGIVVHEIGHALGFWHEHSRPDRDSFIQMVAKNFNHNYGIVQEIDSLGQPYDFASIMHYQLQTAKGVQMMRVRPELAGQVDAKAIGQRIGLSDGDVKQANLLYRCPACGGTFQGTQGSLKKAANSRENHCQWRISTKKGRTLALTMTSFDVPCSIGTLEIRDGYYKGSPLIGRYCDSNIPRNIESKSRRLWLELRSRGPGASFTASYKAQCNFRINQEMPVTSPGFPGFYEPNSNCDWSITAPRGRRIMLTFDQTFYIERTNGCKYDFLEVKDGGDASAAVIGRFCGNQSPRSVTSRGNQLFFHFESDNSVQNEGFKAQIRFV